MTTDAGVTPQTSSTLLRSVANRLSDAAWSVSHQLKRLSDFMQGHAALSKSCAWLMGVQYGSSTAQEGFSALQPEVLEQLLHDFRSRVWCTYRREFSALGTDGLASDVGWGCTIRSGQMMMAETLSRHQWGRGWRRAAGSQTAESQACEVISQVVDDPQAALSIHQICAAGHGHGIVPGRWLGPWVLCKSLAALVATRSELGLRVHVVCDPGGGAPSLNAVELMQLFSATGCAIQLTETAPPLAAAEHARPQPQTVSTLADTAPSQAADVMVPAAAEQAEPAGDEPTSGLAVAGHPGDAMEVSPQGCTALAEASQSEVVAVPEPAVHQKQAPAPLDTDADIADDIIHIPQQQPAQPAETPPARVTHAQCTTHAPAASSQPLLLLLPLTLGVGKVNSLYHPQLLQVLSLPQSVGIVGGRPSTSLYFIGHQDQNLLYLDPHVPQPATPLPLGLSTYFCDTIRLMPISSIDPSLAIGFYCRGREELESLIASLDRLAQEHRQAPLLTVCHTAADREPSHCLTREHSGKRRVTEGSWDGHVVLPGEGTSGAGHKRRASNDSESWEVL